jgi:hypothetical protein
MATPNAVKANIIEWLKKPIENIFKSIATYYNTNLLQS